MTHARGPVLVTGAAGFVGARATASLLARGHAVVALVRRAERAARLRALRPAPTVVECDLDSSTAVEDVLRSTAPRAVLHLAWYAHPADYLGAIENTASLLASAALFEAAARHGATRLVGVGTCLEYAPADRPRHEDDPTRPASLYAACKLAAGCVGHALAQRHGLAFVWARLFHLHGPGEAAERLLPWVARSLRAGRACELSPGTQVRDQLHVDDAGEALALLCETGAGVFNVCSGRPVSLRTLLETLADHGAARSLLRFGARPEPGPELRFLCGDPGRLRALGWRPRHTDLAADLRELWAAAA